jgi:DNA polymerase III epsilon subunit-like protein
MLFYILDTETNGLKAGYHEITQISIIRCSDRVQLTRDIKIEYPERSSFQALEVTGRTLYDLLSGEQKEKVVEDCEKFWAQDKKTPEHRCLVAHNASFDKRFCHALWQSCGKKFPVVCWMDTLPFVKKWAKYIGCDQKKFSLDESLKFANIPIKETLHNASSDAKHLFLLWKKGMDARIDHLSSIKRFPHIAIEESLDIEE